MNTEDSPALRQAKEAMRKEVQADLYEKLRELRVANPGLKTAELMEQLKESSPELVACAERIEADDWSAPKQPVYRYDPSRASVRVQARKTPKEDDGELMLVYGSDGRLIGLELG